MTDQQLTMALGKIIGFKNLNKCAEVVIKKRIDQISTETNTKNTIQNTNNVVSIKRAQKIGTQHDCYVPIF